MNAPLTLILLPDIASYCTVRVVALYMLCLFYGVGYSLGLYLPPALSFFLSGSFPVYGNPVNHRSFHEFPLSKRLERASSDTSKRAQTNRHPYEGCSLRNIFYIVFRIRRDFPTSERSVRSVILDIFYF